MKRKDDTIAILFVTILAVLIWVWAAARTEDELHVNTTLHFTPSEGSISTISPESKSVRLTFKGPRSSLNAADEACLDGIALSIPADDGEITLDFATRINKLDAIRETGAEVIGVDPSSITLKVQTMVLVEAAVEQVLPGVTVSGDVTVDPATVNLLIPKQLKNQLPEAFTVSAIVSETVLEQLQPGIMHTRDATIQLPDSLIDQGVIIEPNRVSLSFKIQSKMDKTVLPQLRILIAGPAEDYSAFSVALPVKIIPNVTIEADKDLISNINSGNVTVFAIVRLASRDMEQRIESKQVTSFLAMLEDGTGIQVKAVPEDAASLNVALQIVPTTQQGP